MADIELTTVPTETTIDIANDFLWMNDVSETPDAINKITPTSLRTAMFASGDIDGGALSSFEIPNSAAPTVNADGEIAVDTTVADFSHGILKYFGGEEMAVIAVPIAELTGLSNGDVLSYSSTADEFQFGAAAGGAMAIGGAITSATAGSVLFADASGQLGQDNAALFWDITNDRLGININASLTHALEVRANASNNQIRFGRTGDFVGNFSMGANSVDFNLNNGGGSQVLTITQGGLTDIFYGLRVGSPGGATTGTPIKSQLLAAHTGDAFQVLSSGAAVLLGITAAGGIDMLEQTAPAAPAANRVILYAVDNASGKTQLMAIFATGAAQQIAIQP